MRRVFGKRTLRELRAHKMRYLALAAMIFFAMYLIVSLIGAADTVIIGAREHADANHIEDGQFTVFVPLSDKELATINERGAQTEKMFCREYEAKDGSVLRVFRIRKDIDLAELEWGAYPENDGQVMLEKRYCEVKGLQQGDTIEIAGKRYEVTGCVTTPDYDGLFRDMGDSTADSANFGTAFVTDALYDKLAASGKSLRAEEYLYAYRLDGGITDKELKDLLKTFRYEPSSVDDPYFQEYWDQIYGKRDELLDGVDELTEGSRDMEDALAQLEKRLGSDDMAVLRAFLPEEFFSELSSLSEAGTELADGSEELSDAVHELIDKYLTAENDNLRTFVTAEDNPRIGAAADDVVINKYGSLVAGVIVLALIAYVISVFVIHSIEEEQSVIGTLYALGVRRGELIRHYLVLPVLVTLAAGVIGTYVGYSRWGVPVQTADTYAYFSVPSLRTVIEPWVIIYGAVMPPVVAALVDYIVIRRRLSAPALAMIRGEEKRRDYSQLDLGNMSYIRRFRLRQLLREGRSAAGVVLGIFVCLLLMMLSIDCYVLCDHVGRDSVTDTKYEYMYLYKYPEEKVPAGGSPAYAETLKKEAYGYNMDVTVLGIEKDNPYFDADVPDSQSHVLISSAMAQKYSLRNGDKFLADDPQNDRMYAFTVDGVVDYTPAFYIFMDIDSMRDLFGADDDYYNVVFSDRELDIDAGRLYSVSSRDDVIKAADIFNDLLYGMVVTMLIASTVILAIVMYLMMKVMIDRSAQGIALFKIFGYNRRELRKLYISGNTALIIIGTLVSIPLSKFLMDAVFPVLVSNVACAVDLTFEPWMYAALFGGITVLYAVINKLLVRRIDKIEPNVVLKNRE